MKVFPATAAGLLLLAMLALAVGPSASLASHIEVAVVILVCLALCYKLATEKDRLRLENAAGRAEVERLRMDNAAGSAEVERLRVENEAGRAEKDRFREENKAGRAEVERLRKELEAATTDLQGVQQQNVLLTYQKDVAAAEVHKPHEATTKEQQSKPVYPKDQLFSLDPKQQYEGTKWLSKHLSIKNPPIDEVTSLIIRYNIMPLLVNFLKQADVPQLQFETACVLTNLACGKTEHTNLVIDAGAVPILVELLASPRDDVREQATWALANIAGDSSQSRDVVLNAGALPSLLEQLKHDSKVSMLRVAALLIANCCRGKPRVNFQVTCSVLPTLARLIHAKDEQVVEDACWALFSLSHGTGYRFAPGSHCIEKFMDAGVVCRRLMKLLVHPARIITIPVLRMVGNLVTGNDMQRQMVIDCGALKYLLTLLTANRRIAIKQEACWTISNLVGTREQKQAVIDANIIPPVLALLQNAEFLVKKEAATAISNMACGGTTAQVKYLVDVGAIKPLCDMLTTPDPNQGVCHVIDALEGLENILKVGEQMRRMPGSNNAITFAQLVKDADGLSKIVGLQEHPDEEVHKMVVSILKTYFESREGGGQIITH